MDRVHGPASEIVSTSIPDAMSRTAAKDDLSNISARRIQVSKRVGIRRRESVQGWPSHRLRRPIEM